MSDNIYPTWAEVNLDAFSNNIREVRRVIGNQVKCCAVIKADAYGHGVKEVARRSIEEGADYLAVATLGEAIELREYERIIPILILGFTPNQALEQVVTYNITQTVYTYECAKTLSREAVAQDKIQKLHLKIDTGMSRLGFQVNDKSVGIIERINQLPNIEIEGIFTHFARADECIKDHTHEQFALFEKMLRMLLDREIKIPIRHVANSATIIDLPKYHLDMVRAGIMLYGYYPGEVDRNRAHLQPVMTLKTRLSYVKELPKGRGVSYGHLYRTKGDTLIGTCPIGYADGLRRNLTGRFFVCIDGKRYPQVGRICMDQIMVKLTDSYPIGQEVIIFGNGKCGEATVEDMASLLDTISYEITCMVGKRVPRVYT